MDDDYVFGAITKEFVMARPWRLYSPHADVATDELFFLPDGSVSGYRTPDEWSWLIEDGALCFVSHNGEIRTRFDIKSAETIRLLLRGAYKGNLNIVLTLERRGWSLNLPIRVSQLCVTYDLSEASLASLGLSLPHVNELFYGRANAPRPRVTLSDTPDEIAQYINSQHRAASFSYSMISNNAWHVDVFTGHPTRCVATLTRDNCGETPYPQLPFFYKFVSQNGQDWWAISQHVTSQIDALYLPELNVALVRNTLFDSHTITNLIRDLEIAAEQARIGPIPVQNTPYIAVIDLIESHGHQLINHLPALQRLLEEGCSDKVKEIWILGTEFFGPTQAIFPEFKGRILRFNSRWRVAAAIRSSGHLAFLLSTYGMSAAFQNRLQVTATKSAPLATCDPQPRHPLIAFTVRGAGRVFRNLADVIVQIVTTLLVDYPNLGIILDGGSFRKVVYWRVHRSSQCGTAFSTANR